MSFAPKKARSVALRFVERSATIKNQQAFRQRRSATHMLSEIWLAVAFKVAFQLSKAVLKLLPKVRGDESAMST